MCVIGLLPTLGRLVDRHRAGPSAVSMSPVLYLQADVRLVVSILAIFAGVLTAYGAWTLWLPPEQVAATFDSQLAAWLRRGHRGFEPGVLSGIMLNNLLVALGVLILSALYRTGGALLVLAWNASVWGVQFAWIARLEWGSGLPATGGWLVVGAAVLPHVLLEAAGYVLMALCGLALVRLAVRFHDPSLSRRRLVRNLALLAGAAVLCVLAAALAETFVAGRLLQPLG